MSTYNIFSTLNVQNFTPTIIPEKENTKSSRSKKKEKANSNNKNRRSSKSSNTSLQNVSPKSADSISSGRRRPKSSQSNDSLKLKSGNQGNKKPSNRRIGEGNSKGTSKTSSSSKSTVNKTIPDPPILTFDASFESGNLGHVEATSPHEYNLQIRHDTNNNRFRLWYYFSVSNFKANQIALFTINNFSKGRSLFRTGLTPLVKINDDGHWFRTNPNNCWYYKPEVKENGGKINKNADYCLSWVFRFPDLPEIDEEEVENSSTTGSLSDDVNEKGSGKQPTNSNFSNIGLHPEDRNSIDSFTEIENQKEHRRNSQTKKQNKIYFAYCFPYTYTRLQNFIEKITNDPNNELNIQRELVSMTAQRRRVELLTISSPANLQRMSVFDRNNSQCHISGNHPFGINPYGFSTNHINLRGNFGQMSRSSSCIGEYSTNSIPTSSTLQDLKTNENNLTKLHQSYIPIVFVSARVHPGESPSSYAMEEFIRYLLSNEGKALRNVAVFKIVPMINPDGVAVGNYRCSTYGFDLNRQYQEPSAWNQPEIFGIKDVLERYLFPENYNNNNTPQYETLSSVQTNPEIFEKEPIPNIGVRQNSTGGFTMGPGPNSKMVNSNKKSINIESSSAPSIATIPEISSPLIHQNPLNQSLQNTSHHINSKLELYIDLHGHSLLNNCFMYGNYYENNDELSRKQHILPKIFDKIASDFSLRHSNFNSDSCKNGSARRTFEKFHHALCYTLEISMSHYFSKFTTEGMFYEEKSYLEIGKSLARSMEVYFSIRKPGRKSIARSSLGPTSRNLLF